MEADNTFQMMEIDANGNVLFYIVGNGQVVSDKGGIRINADGLYIESGGATILDGGLFVQNTLSDEPVVHINMHDPDFQSVGLNITSDEVASFSNYYFLQAVNTDGQIFTIRGDGLTTISRGGLSIESGGATIVGGLYVFDGQTIVDGGLHVEDGDVYIQNGALEVRENGAIITSTLQSVSPLVAEATNNNFDATVLNVRTSRESSDGDQFNMIEIVTASETLSSLAGDGLK